MEKTRETKTHTQLPGPVEETKGHTQLQGSRETGNSDGALTNSAEGKTTSRYEMFGDKTLPE